MLPLDRTYIRVRRKRSAAAAEAICLEGLAGADPDGTDGPSSNDRRRVAIWRRVGDPTLHLRARKRDYRVLDVVLEEENLAGDCHVDNTGDDETESQTPTATSDFPARKRRRLTFFRTGFANEIYRNDNASPRGRPASRQSSKGGRGTGIRILGPAERLVDDSLRQVFSGDLTVPQHFRFLSSDPRLADQFRRWCVWRNDEHGSLLHACAIWNEHETISELLQVLMLDTDPASPATTRDYSFIVDCIDGEGRTPYRIAEMSRHDLVCQVLEAYGAGDYDCDLYALDDGHANGFHDVTSGNEGGFDGDGGCDNYLSCELQGAMGYWNDSGQLILQPTPPHTTSNISLRDEDESIDSNHENWEGNDYPDVEGEGFYDGELDDDSSGHDHGMNQECSAFGGVRKALPVDVVDPHGDFDAAYGIYGQGDMEDYDYEL